MSKPKKILILSRFDERPNYDTAPSMVKMLSPSNFSIEYSNCFLEQLAFIFDGKELQVIETTTGRDLKYYDGVFLVGWFKTHKLQELALSVAKYMDASGKKVLNSEALTNRSRGKLSQYVTAALNGIPTMPFVATGDNTQLPELIKKIDLLFPFIAKSASASRGDNNYLVKNMSEFKQVIAELPVKIIITQEFIKNDGDYRILVMGGSVRLVIHRRSQSESHLNNTSVGGVATIVPLHELNQNMLADSVKIAGLLGREITGVDMVMDMSGRKYYFLEANNMPQLSTGSAVEEKAAVLDRFFSEWLKS